MDFVSRTQKSKIERLKKQLENSELRNKKLQEQNEELKNKIESYETIIADLKNSEAEFNKRLDEVKELKEKYKQVISEAYKLKMRCSREMESLIKQFKKEF